MKYTLLKIARILLILIGGYFALGLLASLVLIVMEFNLHQLSNEILRDEPNFEIWIIYVGLSLFALVCGGLSFVCFFGVWTIKKAK